MRPIFSTCIPRPEVLQGVLTEDVFAARLKQVMDGQAGHDYQDAVTFFATTYPTDGLKLLLTEALGRLNTPPTTNSPIIRLETAFGGGKTHNLIALYHAVKGGLSPADLPLLDPQLIPQPHTITVVGVVGSDLDPTSGIAHPDVTTYTLWGEIAYQLGGVAGYNLLAESDTHTKSAPGTNVLERLVAGRPTLIMLDEVARHLRTAQAIPTATNKGTLADQTVAFLMSLMEFAVSQTQVVVVFTLADSQDSFGKETEFIHRALVEAQRVSARQEKVIVPTGEEDIAAIVSHRLFSSVDSVAAQEVAMTYHAYYQTLLGQSIDLSPQTARAGYTTEIAQSYPFHPDLLTVLNRKISTIPNFQKTRGALRLLAATVRNLWQTQPPDTFLIHPHHIALDVEHIAKELTSHLSRPNYKQVIEADIVSALSGSQAHAQYIDVQWIAAQKPSYAQRVATTVFLHSLTQGTPSGVSYPDVLTAVLQPTDDPLIIRKATDMLVDTCWFLSYTGERYRFSTEPQLNKIVQDEMAMVGVSKAKAKIDEHIRKIWVKGLFEPLFFVSEPSEVDDNAGLPKLIVIHYDAAHLTAQDTAEDTAPPKLVQKIAEYAGNAGSYRKYRNNLLFLVADEQQREHMVDTAKYFLAISRIVDDESRLLEFIPDQRKKLKGMRDTKKLDIRLAITRTYRYLFYPTADAPKEHAQLVKYIMPPQDQGDIEKDQSAVVLRVLRQLEKALTADDSPISPVYVVAKAWEGKQPAMTTEAIRRVFASRVGLQLILDMNQLKKTIRQGIQNGTWIYYDAQEQRGYGAKSPPPTVKFDDDTLLYLPQAAKEHNLIIVGEEPDDPDKPDDSDELCPVCEHPQSQCVCADQVKHSAWGISAKKPPPNSVKAEGVPTQAFQALFDQCNDYQLTTLSRVELTLTGTTKDTVRDTRALGVVIPQLGYTDYRIDQELVAEFGKQETFHLKFTGSWERYKSMKTLTENLAEQATNMHIRTTLTLNYPQGMSVAAKPWQSLIAALTPYSMGNITVQAYPTAKESS